MKMEDWKDKLAALNVPEAAEEEPEAPSAPQEKPAGQTEPLRLILDRKGRKGKVATIVEGFEIPDEEVDEIASMLKRKIGTGGSSRDGEILLQGDWRDKAAELLQAAGFKTKKVGG